MMFRFSSNQQVCNRKIILYSTLILTLFPDKFDKFKLIIKKKFNILVITETKSSSNFPDSQFIIAGFRQP